MIIGLEKRFLVFLEWLFYTGFSVYFMFDCYYCINLTKYSPKFMKRMALYFVTVSYSTGGLKFSLIFMFQAHTII